MDAFITDYALPLLWIILKIVAIILPLLGAVAYLTLAERKVMAAMQRRKGPNVRHIVAQRLWNHHCGMGIEFEIFVFGRFAFCGADGFL